MAMANGDSNGRFSWREITVVLTVIGGIGAGIWLVGALSERVKIMEERVHTLETAGSRPLERMGEHLDRLDERMDEQDKRLDVLQGLVLQVLHNDRQKLDAK